MSRKISFPVQSSRQCTNGFFSYFTTEELTHALQEIGYTVVSLSVEPTGKSRWVQVIGQKAEK